MAKYKRIGDMIRFKDGDREFWFDPSQLGTPAADSFKKWLDEGNEPDPDDTASAEPINWRRLGKRLNNDNRIANRLDAASAGKIFALSTAINNQDLEDLVPTLTRIRDSLGLTPQQLTNFNENVNELLSDCNFPSNVRIT